MPGAQPLLLHSLVEFDELIHACLDLAGAQTVLEIGSESGGSTKRLLAALAERDGELWCVEPGPTRELEELARSDDHFHLIEGRSPAALDGLPACDAYVVDGDHNYWTVARELEHVGGRVENVADHPLVILHDVTWPCGRRDQYYAPGALPADAVHPYAWDLGAVLGEQAPVPAGLRGRGSFAVARTEGGPANGVRTAVEDYVAARDGLGFVVVPAIFGLGILYAEGASYAGALAQLIDPLDDNPLLDRMERNRLELYLAVLRAQQDVAELGLRQGRLLTEYDSALTAAETEAAALRQEVARLRTRSEVQPHLTSTVNHPGEDSS